MQTDYNDKWIVCAPSLNEPKTPAEIKRIGQVVEQFPPGSLVTIQWISTTSAYDEEERGIELEVPEPAIVLRHIPEHAFMSMPKGWVVPFECIHQGAVRVSTTYAAEPVEHST